MNNDFAERVRAAIKKTGMSNEDLAIKIGSHPVTMSKLLTGKMNLNEKWLKKIADGLGMSVDAIIAEPLRTREVPTPVDMVPVFGLAAASVRGNFTMTNDPVEYVPRPRILGTVRDAYALTVTGSSMEPRYFPGDVIFIHPGREPNPRDHVVIQESLDGGTTVSVKRFDRKTLEHIFTWQYNPPGEIRFLRRHVTAMHRVLTPNEIAGV